MFTTLKRHLTTCKLNYVSMQDNYVDTQPMHAMHDASLCNMLTDNLSYVACQNNNVVS